MSALWGTALVAALLFASWGTAFAAEQRIYLEPKLYSYVKYRGDLSHPKWNPRNQSTFYKTFEFGPLGKIRITFKNDRRVFAGTDAGARYRLSVDGMLSKDWKTLERLTVNYQRDMDIRKELWSFTLADIPLTEQTNFEDGKAYLYKLVGVDGNCKPFSLRPHVTAFASEHLFSDGKAVVLDELMIDHSVCNVDGLTRPGGLYNVVANYQVPMIQVSLYEEKPR